MRKQMTILLFFLILLIPLLFINTKSEQVSEIDNRPLAEWTAGDGTSPPVTDLRSWNEILESYLSDRIGFRKEMIGLYGNMNNFLFHNLKHPSFEYGLGDEVFYTFKEEVPDSNFVNGFYQFLVRADEYLKARNIDFVFAINPSKNQVYPEYVPKYIHTKYSNSELLREKLADAPFTAIDNISLLPAHKTEGRLYHTKFDAGHWSDLGAFYGIQSMFEPLLEKYPSMTPMDLSRFEVQTKTETYLPISNIVIDEKIETLEPLEREAINEEDLENGIRKQMIMSPSHRTFKIYRNPANPNGPRLLFFRGSFLNRRDKLYVDSFSQVVEIHNYENVFNMDYYLNLFPSDIVFFEVAATAFLPMYFNHEVMTTTQYNPPPKSFAEYSEGQLLPEEIPEGLSLQTLQIGTLLTTIRLNLPEDYDDIYLLNGDTIYDVHTVINAEGCKKAYVSLQNGVYRQDAQLILVNRESRTKVQLPLEELPLVNTEK